VGFIFGQRINKDPIRFNMVIAAAGKTPPQWMILIFRRQRPAVDQDLQNRFKFGQISLPRFWARLTSFLNWLVRLKVLTSPGQPRARSCG
jgi:hypothetical protein